MEPARIVRKRVHNAASVLFQARRGARLSDILFRVQRKLALGVLVFVASLCVQVGGNALKHQSASGSQSAQNPPPQKQPPPQPAQPPQNPQSQIPAAPPPQAPATPQPVPETLRTVVIDPGHGGLDTGARSSTGIEEKDVVLNFARQIQSSLRAQGFNVIMTRIADVDPSLDDRATVANAQKDAIFISLHVGSGGPAATVRTYAYLFPSSAPSVLSPSANASGNPSARVAPADFVLWREAQQPFLAQSRKLGDLIQAELAQKFKGSPEISSSVPVAVLRSVMVPAVAVEVSNISEDQQELEDMGADLADGIARAVVAYKSI